MRNKHHNKSSGEHIHNKVGRYRYTHQGKLNDYALYDIMVHDLYGLIHSLYRIDTLGIDTVQYWDDQIQDDDDGWWYMVFIEFFFFLKLFYFYNKKLVYQYTNFNIIKLINR